MNEKRYLIGGVIGLAIALLFVTGLSVIGWYPTNDDVSTLLSMALGAMFTGIGMFIGDDFR
jgi:hypothetical protein